MSVSSIALEPQIVCNLQAVLCNLPFGHRIEQWFGFDGALREITFVQFCKSIAVLTEYAPKLEKLKFAFFLYDQNGDGVISRQDLMDVLDRSVKVAAQPKETSAKTQQRATKLKKVFVDRVFSVRFHTMPFAAIQSPQGSTEC